MRKLTLPIIILSFLPAVSFGGYSKEIKRLEKYEPPKWLSEVRQDQTTPAVGPEVTLPKSRNVELKAVPYFFLEDSERSAALKNEATDSAAALKFLEKSFSLGDLEILGMERNLEIKAAKREVEARLESISIARSLGETLRAYGAYTDSSMPEVGAVMKDPDSYPYPGVGALRGQVAAWEVTVGKEKLEAKKAQILTSIRKNWWELRYITAALAIGEERLELLTSVSDAAGSRYSTGDGALGEIAMIKAEVAEAKNELATLAAEKRSREDAILSYLALPSGVTVAEPDRDVAPLGDLPPVADLQIAARTMNRDVRAMKADISRMETMVEMSESMTYANFDQSTSRFENRIIAQSGTGAMEAGFKDSPSASEGIASPKKPNFSAEDGYIRQTRARIAGAKASLQNEGFGLDRMVREAWTNYDEGRRGVALYRDNVAEYAKLALDTNLSNYRAGKGSFGVVLGNYRAWLNAALGVEAGNAKMGAAVAELENLTGNSPLAAEAGVGEQTK